MLYVYTMFITETFQVVPSISRCCLIKIFIEIKTKKNMFFFIRNLSVIYSTLYHIVIKVVIVSTNLI